MEKIPIRQLKNDIYLRVKEHKYVNNEVVMYLRLF